MDPIDIWKDYATIPELAAGLDCHERTVRRKINQPNGWPYVLLAGKIRLHVPTIRKIIEAETISRNPPRSGRRPGMVAAE